MYRHNKYNVISGFTLIELISVIVILGILAATALPKFINVSTEARVNSVNYLASAIKTAAYQWHGICQMKRAECNVANGWPNTLSYQGYTIQFANDFPEAGDNIASNQIDALVDHHGFTVSLEGSTRTRFSLDDAPDSTNCAVTYNQAASVGQPQITSITTGC